ncbi:MAG: substrate-binding domain-containing protein [Anaerolineae bacterium]|nr:substrate-binding domain-containing protein [Anaerolineae bacterium]
MGRASRTLAAVAFTLVSCSTQIIPAATPTTNVTALRLYATTSTIPLVRVLTTHYSRLNPSISFEISTGDYGAMVREVMRDESAYLITNHLDDDSPLWAAPIGQDGIAVIVHPDNNLARLTTAQVRLIYQGWTERWSDVGGRGGDILVISRENGSGTRAEFEGLIMGARRTTPIAQIAPSSEAVVASVARQPDSIGYVSMSYLNDSVRALALDGAAPTLDNVYDNVYPLRSIVYVAGQHEPSADDPLEQHYRAFIGWIQSQDGQTLVGREYAPLLRGK